MLRKGFKGRRTVACSTYAYPYQNPENIKKSLQYTAYSSICLPSQETYASHATTLSALSFSQPCSHLLVRKWAYDILNKNRQDVKHHERVIEVLHISALSILIISISHVPKMNGVRMRPRPRIPIRHSGLRCLNVQHQSDIIPREDVGGCRAASLDSATNSFPTNLASRIIQATAKFSYVLQIT